MTITIERYGRFWAVRLNGQLLCVTVYRKGARAVQALLHSAPRLQPS